MIIWSRNTGNREFIPRTWDTLAAACVLDRGIVEEKREGREEMDHLEIRHLRIG